MKWTKEQQERFEKFILGDDMDFYEEYTIHLTDEEQEKFFAENPEFMSEYPISRDMIHLLRDPMYRGLMRKIKKYETGEREKYCLDEFRVQLENLISCLDHCGDFNHKPDICRYGEAESPSRARPRRM
mgnify:CR=1 FL=1